MEVYSSNNWTQKSPVLQLKIAEKTVAPNVQKPLTAILGNEGLEAALARQNRFNKSQLYNPSNKTKQENFTIRTT
jgi:hypothetical protein